MFNGNKNQQNEALLCVVDKLMCCYFHDIKYMLIMTNKDLNLLNEVCTVSEIIYFKLFITLKK